MSNLFQRWNESFIAPFKQLHEGRDVCWARIEVVALVGVFLGEPDEVEQVLSSLFGVRRGLSLFAPALPQWVGGAVNVNRSNRDGVPARPVVRVICTIGIERVRDVQIANIAMAGNVIVEVRAAPLPLRERLNQHVPQQSEPPLGIVSFRVVLGPIASARGSLGLSTAQTVDEGGGSGRSFHHPTVPQRRRRMPPPRPVPGDFANTPVRPSRRPNQFENLRHILSFAEREQVVGEAFLTSRRGDRAALLALSALPFRGHRPRATQLSENPILIPLIGAEQVGKADLSLRERTGREAVKQRPSRFAGYGQDVPREPFESVGILVANLAAPHPVVDRLLRYADGPANCRLPKPGVRTTSAVCSAVDIGSWLSSPADVAIATTRRRNRSRRLPTATRTPHRHPRGRRSASCTESPGTRRSASTRWRSVRPWSFGFGKPRTSQWAQA